VSNENNRNRTSLRSYPFGKLGTSEGRYAFGLYAGTLWDSRRDGLASRPPNEEVSLMGFEIIGILLFARLMEISQLLRENAGLLFFSTIFMLLWLGGIITVVRRWSGE